MIKLNKEPNMAKVDIGELLALKRGEKGLSLAMAASKTKLSSDNIKHLEANEFSLIGSSVYVRGYLGIYANFLGLDAANLIQLYNTQHPANDEERKSTVNTVPSRKKIKRHSKTVSALLALVSFAVLSYAYSRIEPLVFTDTTTSSTVSSEVSAATEGVSSPVDTAIQAAQDAGNLAEDVLNGLPVTESRASASLQPSDNTAQGNDVDVPPMPALSLESTIELESSAASDDSKNQNKQSKAGQMTLDLRFNDECWLQVTDKKGKVLAAGTYHQKKQLSVVGTGPFTVTTWRPKAVTVTVFNGKPVNLVKYQTGKKTYRLQ